MFNSVYTVNGELNSFGAFLLCIAGGVGLRVALAHGLHPAEGLGARGPDHVDAAQRESPNARALVRRHQTSVKPAAQICILLVFLSQPIQRAMHFCPCDFVYREMLH